ncbi:FecR family protein [Methylomonas sp. MED-D]|uniref:FecR family protein n=1 Tax=unclassified Methylomonas TaxID=2608980 RepID=UPI0028A3CB4E|nr:FecR family protein [Methylomonas sp. MV1]MDT4328682.1 FecR family protein [Methylomonas sp. MV1]
MSAESEHTDPTDARLTGANGFPELPAGPADEQALYWLTLISSGEANAGHRAAFQDWLRADPTHHEAWRRAQALWRDIAQLGVVAAPIATASLSDAHRSPRRFGIQHLGLAASVLIAAVLSSNQLGLWLADHRTAPGQQLAVALADGSQLLLDTDTAVSVHYSDTRRLLELHRGKIWCRVAANADRPFEVSTGQGTVRALGTAFDVAEQDDRTEVTVYEHAVRIDLANGAHLPMLAEGTAVGFGEGLEPVNAEADTTTASAWHRQQLQYFNRPLSEVVAELNRYRRGRIFLAERDLEQLRLSGIFDTSRPDEALALITESLGLHAYQLAGRWVFLRRG